MAANSKIEWTDHTFNPWRGCTKVAEGCKFCYADALSNRNPGTLGIWGPNGTRVMASRAMWQQPIIWDKAAADAEYARDSEKPLYDEGDLAPYERPRVFCASLADVFEDWDGPISDSQGRRLYRVGPTEFGASIDAEDGPPLSMDDLRRALFALIDATPNLDWLVLTKRPENIRRMWSEPNFGNRAVDDWYRHNVWLGTSIATQADADKNIPELLKCRDLSPVLFVSAEPLLGPISLTTECDIPPDDEGPLRIGYMVGPDDGKAGLSVTRADALARSGIDWVIAGGESGHNARPCCLEHIDDLRHQCEAAGVPFFAKQLGAFPVTTNSNLWDFDPPQLEQWGEHAASTRIRLNDKKGGDWNEWPEALRVREFPKHLTPAPEMEKDERYGNKTLLPTEPQRRIRRQLSAVLAEDGQRLHPIHQRRQADDR